MLINFKIHQGLLLYVFGLAVNLDSDGRLRQLRSKKVKKDDSSTLQTNENKPKTRYSIPRGGFFELVSAANYFGEICEWWGFALAAKLIPSSIWFAGFTTIFLGLRGIDNHRYVHDNVSHLVTFIKYFSEMKKYVYND